MNKSFITFFAGLIVLIIFGLYVIPGDVKEKNNNELIFGTNVGYPPFIFADEQGAMVGLGVDIARAVAQQMNKKVRIEHMAFDALIIALKQNKVDAIIGGLAITPSRLAKINMIPYFGENQSDISLLFWKKIPEGVKNIDDLIDKVKKPIICTQTGSTMFNYLEQFGETIVAKSLSEIDELVLDVRFGKSTAALLETKIAQHLAGKDPELKVLTYPLAEKDIIRGMGIGVNKNNDELFSEMSKAIDTMRESGELKKYVDRWFSEEKE